MPRKPARAKPPNPPSGAAAHGDVESAQAIRNLYAEHGVAGCYERRGATYRNPFEAVQRELLGMAVERFSLDLADALDLACGSGEATLALRAIADEKTVDGRRAEETESGSADRLPSDSRKATSSSAALGASFVGVDPFTGAAYRERTGLVALPLSFEQIADGALAAALPGRRFTLIACCCALHLCEASRLPALLWRLRDAAPTLLVVTPNKRPEIRAEWGWRLEGELLHKRLRARVYCAEVEK